MNIMRKVPRQSQTKLQGSDMKPVAKLGNDVKAKIGHHLREMYDELVDQGVPDRLASILRVLDEPAEETSRKEPSK